MITEKMRIAIIQKATETPNAKQVYKEINEAVGRVSYATVLKVIKATGIDLTEAAGARMKRRHADPEYAAANRERMKRRRRDPEFAARQATAASDCMKRLHADPEFEAKRIAGIRNAKAKRHGPA